MPSNHRRLSKNECRTGFSLIACKSGQQQQNTAECSRIWCSRIESQQAQSCKRRDYPSRCIETSFDTSGKHSGHDRSSKAPYGKRIHKGTSHYEAQRTASCCKPDVGATADASFVLNSSAAQPGWRPRTARDPGPDVKRLYARASDGKV